MPSDARPCPLAVEVHEDPGAPPGDLVAALAELLLARARSRVQAATALPLRRQREDEPAARGLDEIGI
jgi:hypothetical protein